MLMILNSSYFQVNICLLILAALMCYQPIALWVRGGISKSSSKDDFPNMELVIDPPQD